MNQIVTVLGKMCEKMLNEINDLTGVGLRKLVQLNRLYIYWWNYKCFCIKTSKAVDGDLGSIFYDIKDMQSKPDNEMKTIHSLITKIE